MTGRYAAPTPPSTSPDDWYDILDGGMIQCHAANRDELEACVSSVVGYDINGLDLHFIMHINQWVYSNSQTLLTLIVNNL